MLTDEELRHDHHTRGCLPVFYIGNCNCGGHIRLNLDKIDCTKCGDNRKDSIVKRELYEKYIEGKYLIRFVLDDRNQMVDMWRNELGLKCLQVAEGNF